MNGYTYYLAIGLDDELFSELNRKFKAAGASEYIQSLKEMYVDFMGMYWLNWNKLSSIQFWVVVKESAVFTVDPSAGFSSVYGTDPHANPGLALSMMAKQVLCPIYCLTHTLIYMHVIAIVSMRYVR